MKSVWLVSEDLLLGSRISAAVASRGIPIHRGTGARTAALQLPPEGGLLLVDLDLGQREAAAWVAEIRLNHGIDWYICGYGSHVDSDGLRALRDAGADRVISRSGLLANLDAILREASVTNPSDPP